MAPETVVNVDNNRPQQPPPPPQQEGGALDWLKINIEYFKSPPGILKIIELVSTLLSFCAWSYLLSISTRKVASETMLIASARTLGTFSLFTYLLTTCKYPPLTVNISYWGRMCCILLSFERFCHGGQWVGRSRWRGKRRTEVACRIINFVHFGSIHRVAFYKWTSLNAYTNIVIFRHRCRCFM